MVDRQQLYSFYVLSHARRFIPDGTDLELATAGALGVWDSRDERRALRTIAEVESEVRRLECAPGADVAAMTRELQQAREAVEHARRLVDELAERDREVRVLLEADPIETTQQAARRIVGMVPDIGPSARDERQRDAAAQNLKRLILADGKTDTGGGWLYDAAADEIVRLRTELERVRQGAAGERAAARLDAAAGLSAEDAATLRGAGWTEVEPGCWMRGSSKTAESSGPRWRTSRDTDLAILRNQARQERARQTPAAAHMGQPGKAAGGEESATTGKGSVAEERRGAQGAPDVAHVVALLRRAEWPRTAESLERGNLSPRQTLEYLRACSSMQNPGADDRVVLDALESLVNAQADRDAAPIAPVALPKPTRVEAGQRWRMELWWVVGDKPAETFDLDVVECPGAAREMVKLTRGATEVHERESTMLTSPRWTFLGPAPAPQGPDGGEEKGGERDELAALNERWRRAHETSAAATDASEPTARDAVAGMLLRHGRRLVADGLAHNHYPPGRVAQRLRDTAPNGTIDAERTADIAALEALARGDLCGARDHVGLAAVIGRVTRERDEARAEAKALREQHETDIRPGPGDQVLFSGQSRVHLVIPKDADAREVLAIVAELLGFKPQDAEPAPDREALGRAVHEAWCEGWGASEFRPNARTWEECSDEDHRVDMLIGERLFAMGAQHGRAEASRDGAMFGVYADILAERMAQDRKWGGPRHDDQHDASEWVDFIVDRARMADEAESGEVGDAEYRKRMVQIAALAVAAVESMDRCTSPPGGAPGPDVGKRAVPADGAPITPPAERYSAPGQDGGDVPADNARHGDVKVYVRPDGWFGLAASDRATHPVASAAPAVPESHAGVAGASSTPWRGLAHEVTRGLALHAWSVVARGAGGELYNASFTGGAHAEARAREYAAWASAPAALAHPGDAPESVADDPAGQLAGIPCASCGKATSTGRCFVCTVAGRGGIRTVKVNASGAREALGPIPSALSIVNGAVEEAPEPSDPRGFCPRHGAPDPYDQCTRCVSAQFPREFEQRAENAPAKPASVLPRQRWRCVGIVGELEVWPADDRIDDGRDVSLAPADRAVGIATPIVRARAVDMLGLPHWTFVSGPRE